MTVRKIPVINAFQNDTLSGLDWDTPLAAREVFTPVKAAKEDSRTLAITDEIGDRGDGRGLTTGIVRGFLSRVGSGPITVNINSTGGDFFTGLAVYSLLREHDGEVNTNVLGIAASAASLIAMASDNLRVAKAGFLMIHNSWAMALGNRHDMQAVSDLLGQFDAAMVGVYADRSGLDRKAVAKFMDDESFFNGEKAVELGLADGLLASDEVEPADDPAPVAAAREMDIQLSKAGLPRSQRRRLMKDAASGKPSATLVVGKPGAADLEILETLRQMNQ